MFSRYSTRELKRFVNFLKTKYTGLGYKVSSDHAQDFILNDLKVVFLFDSLDKNLIAVLARVTDSRSQDPDDYAPVACVYSELGADRSVLRTLHAPFDSKAMKTQTLANYELALDAIFSGGVNSKVYSLIETHKGHTHPFLDQPKTAMNK